MARLRILVQHGKWLQPTLVALLCIGLLVCLLALAAGVGNQHGRFSLRNSWDYQEPDALLVGSWQFATAHSNTSSLLSDRQWQLDVDGNSLLLVTKNAVPPLTLILPLLALFASLALARGRPAVPTTSATRSYAVTHGILSLAVPIVVGLFLVVESFNLEIPFSWTQWSRALVWLGCVGIYFSTFLFLGSWISQHVRHVKTAAWIFLSLFVALFMIQSSRELIMRFDGSYLLPVPDLPQEVRLSLFRPSGEPRVTPDREEMVADYLESVDAYSESVHAVVASRYRLERWWHIVSPQLLLTEISGQLLQTQLANVVDVIAAPKSEDKDPSLAASLMSVGPEMAWLAMLFCIAGLGSWFAARKREISS